jgi:hypothetical protein
MVFTTYSSNEPYSVEYLGSVVGFLPPGKDALTDFDYVEYRCSWPVFGLDGIWLGWSDIVVVCPD